MALFWSANLIFFPTWLFASPEPRIRIKLLALIIVWIITSSIFLWIWQSKVLSVGKKLFNNDPRLQSERSYLLFLILPFLVIINLIAANHPLTSSGDEELHARTFRTIGQGIETLVTESLPGPPCLWYITATLVIISIVVIWWRLINSSNRCTVYMCTILVLVLVVICVTAYLWENTDKLVLSVFPDFEPNNLKAFIRFPPLSKFLWLPASLWDWHSVYILRIPAVLCWLLSGIILYQTVRLQNNTYLSVFPALYLLVLPGMFYYGHLVFLTTPMLMLWCAALYCFERYRLFEDRRFLILCGMALNIGTLMRRATGFFAIGILLYWLWIKVRRHKLNKETVMDCAGIIWFGLSFVFLWSQISNLNDYTDYAKLSRLFDLEKLLSGINDFPYHIGPIASLVLLIVIYIIFAKRRPTFFSPDLLKIGMITIGVSYVFYILFYVIRDERMIGIFPYGRQWQTAHRFLVSWSPFIALLLAEGIGQIQSRGKQLGAGIGLTIVLIAQATFWPAPLTLPEFTSIRLRAGAEHPHLPASEVVRFISDELAKPESKIQVSRELAASYFTDLIPTNGIWYRNGGRASQWTADKGSLFAPGEEQSVGKLIQYCEAKNIDIIVLPLIWLEALTIKPEISSSVLSNSHFKVKRIFNYIGQPAILVAEFVK